MNCQHHWTVSGQSLHSRNIGVILSSTQVHLVQLFVCRHLHVHIIMYKFHLLVINFAYCISRRVFSERANQPVEL
ncbi:hypothetical protein NP493_42g05000 [Ridgeia piscesae]|uniref:Uncharacterized protein n=1 Tax=Ridgeia piscesae TaxID=27915 RepID=A0AAD9PBY9_RIDPI|nr:hypothetical protein NP493_42g05000 [Ridgeia piscesae]